MKQISYLDFSNQHIYVGLDVHHKQWNVSIVSGNILLGRMSREPNTASLVKYLRTNYPGGEYHIKRKTERMTELIRENLQGV
jgi:transposase